MHVYIFCLKLFNNEFGFYLWNMFYVNMLFFSIFKMYSNICFKILNEYYTMLPIEQFVENESNISVRLTFQPYVN